MEQVEKQLQMLSEEEKDAKSAEEIRRKKLLELADKMAAPQLGQAARLELVGEMRSLLNG